MEDILLYRTRSSQLSDFAKIYLDQGNLSNYLAREAARGDSEV